MAAVEVVVVAADTNSLVGVRMALIGVADLHQCLPKLGGRGGKGGRTTFSRESKRKSDRTNPSLCMRLFIHV